ncbi:MAG: TetR family transcriptional regulator, partial [Candidatus Binatia bacterium]
MSGALELFRRQGFEKTTVEEIAAAAGLSPSTFFRYFGSKEDLVFHDLNAHLAFMKERLEVALTQKRVWDAVVDAVIAVVTRFFSASAGHATERFEIWWKEPTLRQRFVVLCLDWEVVIADAVAASRKTRAADDAYSRIVGTVASASTRCAIEYASPRSGFVEDLRSLLEEVGDGLRHEPRPPRANRSPLERAARREAGRKSR